MSGADAADVLLVSLGSTEGLRRADDELRDSLQRAGASVLLARAKPPRAARTLMLTDLLWARAARAAAQEAIALTGNRGPRAIIYSSTTAALLWPRAGAIRFDATSAANRPGRHGLWQRPQERRRLRQAPLLLPWSAGALGEAGEPPEGSERALVLPVPVEPSGPAGGPREIAAVTYAAHPAKKGLDRVLKAWRQLLAGASDGRPPRRASGELVIAGVSAQELARLGLVHPGEPGVQVAGPLSSGEFRALLRRARVFVCAPRREDHGLAQLEALADGCQLVSTRAPGAYAALPIALELDPRLVGDQLAEALRTALEEPRTDYADRAREALAPLRRAAIDRLVAERLLPRLLA